MNKNSLKWLTLAALPLVFSACNKDDDDNQPSTQEKTITIENVLQARSLVESGTYAEDGASPLIMPGQSVSFRFSAAIGQTVTFASMYGWSNDLFFAPANPGIALYDKDKKPIEGDVSDQVKLWDNGTRINQSPGSAVNHPGDAEQKPVTEVKDKDAQGHTYLAASSLVQATLKYEGGSYFTLTLKNISGGTANETPLSPGLWAVSYIAGGSPLNAAPLYASGKPTANGLTALAETGDNSELYSYIKDNTGTFTPLSPVLVVVYNGISNPLYQLGEKDAGKGLKNLAQQGDASVLSKALQETDGVKQVYVLAATGSTVLLPAVGDQPGSSVSQQLKLDKGDRLALATMYGFSNDWFFATAGDGVDPAQTGDISDSIKLFDDGTAVDQYPGAGNEQFNLGGSVTTESKSIGEVPNPNAFTTLPAVKDMIKVTIR
ncbi:spondin domain-containing protein [Compostibacter hankyongensis]|uniref:Spondin domain-containing protein n=1 Tax=Compostibacter hankyongensis TaxID=1007089 RepID=A0ABP8FPP0_9BACT